MALELAGDAAAVYKASDGATKRGYNQAFFKKIYITPGWGDEYGSMKVNVTDAELTEPFAVLLADNLAGEVLAEAEQIREQAAKEKDDPKAVFSSYVFATS